MAKRSRLTALGLALPVLLIGGPRDLLGDSRPGISQKNALARMAALHQQADQELKKGETQLAESLYRSSMLEGWMLIGALQSAGDDAEAARAAFDQAAGTTFDFRKPRQALAALSSNSGDFTEAVRIYRDLITRFPYDSELRRELAQTFFAAGEPAQALAELEELSGLFPDDPETTFALATGYLRAEQPEATRPLFEKISAARPVPQTHILIGRTLRDFKRFEESRRHLEIALEMDPDIPRARFYLGTLVLYSQGRDPLENAVQLFRDELELKARLGQNPDDDTTTHLSLGLTLAELRRFDEAIPHLKLAAASDSSARDAYHNLGRCLLALERTEEAIEAFEKALERSESANFDQRTSLHYQLAKALRQAGRMQEAAPHFEAAKASSTNLASDSRERLQRYLADQPETAPEPPGAAYLASPALRAMSAESRQRVRRETEALLARAYFNLGVMQLKRRRFSPAAGLLGTAASLDPELPQAHRSWAVALFNAGRFAEAVDPLRRASASSGGDAELNRLLALALFNSESYAESADRLAGDPDLASNRALEYTYAVALVRAGRTEAAQPVFNRLMSEGSDWPELQVLIGQAHAKDGDFETAGESFRKALELSPTVPEANAGLGEIHLRRGELESARDFFVAELKNRPDHVATRFQLATTLDLLQEHDQAERQLRRILERRPRHGDSRYLLGKVLLSKGAAEEALPQLEAASQLQPEDPNVFYQLGKALQRLGRTEEAKTVFDSYRRLKKSQREDP